jgi:hypothetical protein
MTRVRKNNNSDANKTNLEKSEPMSVQAQAITPTDETVASGVDRLMEVIEKTVDNLSTDEAERQMLRQGVTTIVQETLLDFMRPQESNLENVAMGLTAPPYRMSEDTRLGTNGTSQTAVDLASRGSQEVGMAFVNFTQGLITGTFNSIIKATIDQMKAYTDMVADLTKSLKEFAADNVSDEAVKERLAQLTLVENGTDFKVAENEKRRLYHLKRLYYVAPVTGGHRAAILKAFGQTDLVDSEGKIDEEKAKVRLDDATIDKVEGIEVNSSKVYQPGDLATIQDAIKNGLARDGMNQLRQMAREGMARIVITEGEINTKLIFQVSSKETNTSNTSKTDSRGFGGSLKAGASWGWGNASVSAYYNQLNVSTVDQTSVGNIETLTQMSGQVIIKFKTDYKPLNDSSGSVRESDLAPIV